jgi:nicotinamide-nucleotide amidase
MTHPTLEVQVAKLAQLLLTRQLMICTAESCTGGMVAAALTDLSGSSSWFERGFITYSNASKHEHLAVPMDLIQTHGAVSVSVAQEMARGALAAGGIATEFREVSTPWSGGDEARLASPCKSFIL